MEPQPRSKIGNSGVDVGLWGFLWACGLLFHFVRPGDPWNLDKPVSIVAACAFALLLTRPRSSIVWAIAALAQIADALYTAVTQNDIQMSWTIVAAVHVTALLTLASVWNRSEEERTQATLDLLAPSLRGAVLAVYFYAVLHKLNAGYFSSLNGGPADMLGRIPLLGPASDRLGLVPYAGHLGLATEAAAFVFLLAPRLRLLGVITAFALHFGLGWIGFRQFAIMFPLLLLFLKPAEGALPRLPAAVARWAPWIVVPTAVTWLRWNETARIGDDLFTALFVGSAAVFLAEIGRRVRRFGPLGVGRPLALPRRIDLVLPAIFVVWCFMPYLGVTTHPCMTMYSHLSVHSGKTNHYFIPAGLQIDAIQGDLVTIVGTTDPKHYPMGAVLPRRALRKALHVDRLRGDAPRYVIWRKDVGEITANRGRLPSPTFLDRLPLISFNGPSALRDARLDGAFSPARIQQRPTHAVGGRPTPDPRDAP